MISHWDYSKIIAVKKICIEIKLIFLIIHLRMRWIGWGETSSWALKNSDRIARNNF